MDLRPASSAARLHQPREHHPGFDDAPPAPTTQVTSMLLDSVQDAPARARSFVTEVVTGPRVTDAALAASELVTNAVVQSDAEVCLTVSLSPHSIKIAVWDSNGDALPTRRTPGPERPGGWGLHLVEAVCASWGFHRASPGKTVWGELAR